MEANTKHKHVGHIMAECQCDYHRREYEVERLMNEHEAKLAAMHQTDYDNERTWAGISFIIACVLCVVVVLFG